MENTKNLKDDLAFIKRSVQKTQNSSVPAIYLLWAVIILVGFTMVDFAPQYVGTYWMFMGPLGGLISGFLGWRASAQLGQINHSDLRLQGVHWLTMMVAILMVTSLVDFGFLNYQGLGLVILAIVSFAYITAGNYLDKALGKFGILMALGFFPIAYFGIYIWSVLGVAVSAGLLLSALLVGKNADQL